MGTLIPLVKGRNKLSNDNDPSSKQSVAEKDLVAEFRDGNSNAMQHIFKLYYKPLVYFANKIINDLPEAEDIISESFYTLYQYREKFTSLPYIRSFLYMAARNACLDYLKAKRRHQASHTEMQYMSSQKEELSDKESHISMAALQKHINNLPSQCARVCKFIFYHNKKTHEIAAIMGTTTKTVLNQKLKAIKLLKQTIKDD